MNLLKYKLFTVPLFVLSVLLLVAAILYEPDLPIEQLKEKYANAQSKFITIDGMSVHYRIEGIGQPLLLIHGTGAMLQTWDEWTHILSAHFKVIRMDIPAFGLTGPRKDGNYSDSMYVDFINQFVEKIGLDSFYLAGNSLGGYISWGYAAAHPQKVKKLILVDPGGFHELNLKGGSLVFKMAKNYPALTDFISKIGTHYIAGFTLKEVFYDDSKVTDEQKKMYADLNKRAGNRHAFIERVQFIKQHKDEELSSITCPTLILWGKEDVLIDIRESEHFKRISNARLITYEHVGHVPQEEIPERSAADVLDFLNK